MFFSTVINRCHTTWFWETSAWSTNNNCNRNFRKVCSWGLKRKSSWEVSRLCTLYVVSSQFEIVLLLGCQLLQMPCSLRLNIKKIIDFFTGHNRFSLLLFVFSLAHYISMRVGWDFQWNSLFLEIMGTRQWEFWCYFYGKGRELRNDHMIAQGMFLM